MEILQELDFASIGFVALFTFGLVAAINFKWKLNSQNNFLLSIVFAFLLGFVPSDWGSMVANKAKEAIAIAVSLTGAYKFIQGVAKKVGTE
jgi:hypothetical protein